MLALTPTTSTMNSATALMTPHTCWLCCGGRRVSEREKGILEPQQQHRQQQQQHKQQQPSTNTNTNTNTSTNQQNTNMRRMLRGSKRDTVHLLSFTSH
jgi:hypothetical protein